jgi:thiol-disulfide isomerase/thioredoxin
VSASRNLSRREVAPRRRLVIDPLRRSRGRARRSALCLALSGTVVLTGCARGVDVVDFGAVPGPGQPSVAADRGLDVSGADIALAPEVGAVLVAGGWDEVAAFVARNAAADRPTLVNLFASWCPPCVREMPLLNAASVAEPDVVFLGVAHLDARVDAERFVTEQDVTFTTVLDLDGAVAGHVGGRGLPVTVVFDRSGRMVGRAFGEVTERGLDDLLALVR